MRTVSVTRLRPVDFDSEESPDPQHGCILGPARFRTTNPCAPFSISEIVFAIPEIDVASLFNCCSMMCWVSRNCKCLVLPHPSTRYHFMGGSPFLSEDAVNSPSCGTMRSAFSAAPASMPPNEDATIANPISRWNVAVSRPMAMTIRGKHPSARFRFGWPQIVPRIAKGIPTSAHGDQVKAKPMITAEAMIGATTAGLIK
jgi:hypothetical protein